MDENRIVLKFWFCLNFLLMAASDALTSDVAKSVTHNEFNGPHTLLYSMYAIENTNFFSALLFAGRASELVR